MPTFPRRQWDICLPGIYYCALINIIYLAYMSLTACYELAVNTGSLDLQNFFG